MELTLQDIKQKYPKIWRSTELFLAEIKPELDLNEFLEDPANQTNIWPGRGIDYSLLKTVDELLTELNDEQLTVFGHGPDVWNELPGFEEWVENRPALTEFAYLDEMGCPQVDIYNYILDPETRYVK